MAIKNSLYTFCHCILFVSRSLHIAIRALEIGQMCWGRKEYQSQLYAHTFSVRMCVCVTLAIRGGSSYKTLSCAYNLNPLPTQLIEKLATKPPARRSSNDQRAKADKKRVAEICNSYNIPWRWCWSRFFPSAKHFSLPCQVYDSWLFPSTHYYFDLICAVQRKASQRKKKCGYVIATHERCRQHERITHAFAPDISATELEVREGGEHGCPGVVHNNVSPFLQRDTTNSLFDVMLCQHWLCAIEAFLLFWCLNIFFLLLLPLFVFLHFFLEEIAHFAKRKRKR